MSRNRLALQTTFDDPSKVETITDDFVLGRERHEDQHADIDDAYTIYSEPPAREADLRGTLRAQPVEHSHLSEAKAQRKPLCVLWNAGSVDQAGCVQVMSTDAQIETHEQRSCLRKKRFDTAPEHGPTMTTYPCTYCGGWHLATKRDRTRGDVTYTPEGWPIVPFAGSR